MCCGMVMGILAFIPASNEPTIHACMDSWRLPRGSKPPLLAAGALIMNKKSFGTDARKMVCQSFLAEIELFSAATSQIYAARPEFIEMDGEVGYNHRKE